METPSSKKSSSSVVDINIPNKDNEFGGRFLTDKNAIFEHNAWDNVEWDEEQEEHAKKQIERQMVNPVPEEEQEIYHREAPEFWNKFYKRNENRFFKDRNWLGVEFPELLEVSQKNVGKKTVMEIGCGAGNTVFPILQQNQNDQLFIYSCDFSSVAVDVVKASDAYNSRFCEAFVWDLTSSTLPPMITPHSVDIIILIFVFSAIHPDQWHQAVENVYTLLRPGGLIIFRDYGRYDLAQLRFKDRRLLSENFYIRGDGTRVYFFSPEEIERIFGSEGKSGKKSFIIEQNAVDRRLIVNRGKRLRMYRVWLQGKFRKPIADA